MIDHQAGLIRQRLRLGAVAATALLACAGPATTTNSAQAATRAHVKTLAESAAPDFHGVHGDEVVSPDNHGHQGDEEVPPVTDPPA